MPSPSAFLYEHEEAALTRLVMLAKQHDAQSSSTVADFLLAWWDAGACGGFDLTALWLVNRTIVQDLFTVFALIVRERITPHTLGLADEFQEIIARWRPALRGAANHPSGVVPRANNGGARSYTAPKSKKR